MVVHLMIHNDTNARSRHVAICSAAGPSIATSSVATSETAATGLLVATAGWRKPSLAAVHMLLTGKGKYPYCHIISAEESQYVRKEDLQLVDAALPIYTTHVSSGAVCPPGLPNDLFSAEEVSRLQ